MGDPITADDPVERLVREAVGGKYRVTAGPVWLMAMPDGAVLPEHGWKLHVSTRAPALPDLVRAIVPVLAAEGCAFKVARSCRVLTELNEGLSAPASVGKAVTIYPCQERVRDLGSELARLLDGWRGPRILSDQRVTDSAPVYYRYGPFAAAWEAGPDGGLRSYLHGPAGEVFDGAATLSYRQPPWATDPFTTETAGRPAASPPRGDAIWGEHYQITAGLRQAAQGNIYRAVDRRDGSAVVIKQARAFVAEDRDGVDARLRLRNERRVLQALDGVAGVPRCRDHLSIGDDEFLVTSDCGPVTLAEDVARRGPYRADAGPRDLSALASGLARVLADVHERGVIMRDLSPKNVVLGEQGPCLVDFGIAGYDGLHLPGGTLGYAPARQWRGEPPARTDDYHALGMTLLYAATGLDPVTLDEDRDQSRIRALQTIASRYGRRPAGLAALIAGLLGDAEPAVHAAFARLCAGSPGSADRLAAPLPVIGPLTRQRAEEITSALAEDLLKSATDMLDSSPAALTPPDASVYRGSAGVGLELLHHPGVPGAMKLIGDLARFSVAAARQVKLPPGLFEGTTGVTIFLQAAEASGIDVPAAPWQPPGTDWQPESSDLTSGTAGVGLGHLWLYQATGDAAHLAVAMRCGQDIVGNLRPSWREPGTEAPAGVDPAAGRAHAIAGITEFLLALAARTGEEHVLAAASRHASQLAERTRALLPGIRGGAAPPIALSWCQGLAGIGQVLLQASVALDDKELARLTCQIADVCGACLPRLSIPARCCGATGVGHFLIDMAVTRQDERFWQAALDVGRQMLLRSGGTPSHPVFVKDSARRKATSWAFGLTGLLSFFRRLARPGEPDILPLPGPGTKG